MHPHRTKAIYALLLVGWLVLAAWQVYEHDRAGEAGRAALLKRAHDISNSLGVVLRSQSRFGMIYQPRMEAALQELMHSEELLGVALLNLSGDVVTSAGAPLEITPGELAESGGVHWTDKSVTALNPVDLGLNVDVRGTTRPTILLPPSGSRDMEPERRGPPPNSRDMEPERRGPPQPRPPRPLNHRLEQTSEALLVHLEYPLDTPTTGLAIVTGELEDGAPFPPWMPKPLKHSVERTSEVIRVTLHFPPDQRHEDLRAILRDDGRDRGGRGGRSRGSPWPFGRPFGMSEEQFRELQEKQGLHGFALIMSTGTMRKGIVNDFWLRLGVAFIALIAAGGFAFAWSGSERFGQLQVRWVRASEMNAHLQDMNVAAAGLAHETRNPLNIVRGLAQLIGKEPDLSASVRSRAESIAEEVDRVTGRLNEFIEYSRPCEARPAPTVVQDVARDVARTLQSDCDDKAVSIEIDGADCTVAADEPLLRQVLFNLLLNAIQAVGRDGRIRVALEKVGPDESVLEVRDDGPGVPPENRRDIFRPYFTGTEQGTGLGLAVVRQIVLAHKWDIEYLAGENGGARFRISGLKLAAKT